MKSFLAMLIGFLFVIGSVIINVLLYAVFIALVVLVLKWFGVIDFFKSLIM